MKEKIYISNPNHLLENGKELNAEIKRLCEKYDFICLEEPEELYDLKSSREKGEEIARKRQRLIKEADIVLVETSDFRSYCEPYGEAGFILGYAIANDKKSYCYMKDARHVPERYPHPETIEQSTGRPVDENGYYLEAGVLNVMLEALCPVIEGNEETALKTIREELK